jgi:hypothetical protein
MNRAGNVSGRSGYPGGADLVRDGEVWHDVQGRRQDLRRVDHALRREGLPADHRADRVRARRGRGGDGEELPDEAVRAQSSSVRSGGDTQGEIQRVHAASAVIGPGLGGAQTISTGAPGASRS